MSSCAVSWLCVNRRAESLYTDHPATSVPDYESINDQPKERPGCLQNH